MTQNQKNQLNKLVQSNEYDIVRVLLTELLESWDKEKGKKTNEFETIWNLAFVEGKIEGAKTLINEIEQC